MKKSTFLDDFEADLKALKDTEQKRQKLFPDDKSIETVYYNQALDAYLDIISICRKYIDKPLDLLNLVAGKGSDAEALQAAVNKIDSMRFVPRLFHPFYSETKRRFFFRADQRCYTLAKFVRLHVQQLQANDTESGLVEIFKKKYSHKIAKVLHSLENRIKRYEYNAEYSNVYDLLDSSEAQQQHFLIPFKEVDHYTTDLTQYREFMKSLEKVEEVLPKLGRLVRNIQRLAKTNTPELGDAQQAYFAAVVEAMSQCDESVKNDLKSDLERLKWMVENPAKSNQPKEPRAIMHGDCVRALETAIRMGEAALQFTECEYAQFLRDDPQPFVEAAKERDSYPALLKDHVESYQDAIHAYQTEADARQIQLYLLIAQQIDRTLRTIESSAKKGNLSVDLADENIAPLVEKVNKLMTALSQLAEQGNEYYRALKDQIMGSKQLNNVDVCLVAKSKQLFAHFATFAKYDPSAKHPLIKKPVQEMNRLSKEFYDQFAPLYQLISGAESMGPVALKCIILPLADELKGKLETLKTNFEKLKDHKSYPGYKKVSEILNTWPVFPVQANAPMLDK